MSEIANIGLLTAFLAGLISFVSPCVLPLVPGYISFIAGRSLDELDAPTHFTRLTLFGQAALFVLGFSTVFIALGASATALGRLLLTYKQEANLIGGIIVVVFGLFMTGLINPRWLHLDLRFVHRIELRGGPVAAYVLGLAFAFGWTPCIGPILGAILTVSASTASIQGGIVLLSVYSLGLGVPFVLTAVFLERFLVHQPRLRRWSRPLHLATGIILIFAGIAIATGQLTKLSYWLLELFPALGRIG
ncbi:MAG TPA: cytochrome c biogenesis protein CcdA [Burkholderiales bacterium]